MPEVPISGREHVLRLACGAVASGGYYPPRAGEADLPHTFPTPRPSAMEPPNRGHVLPVSGREHVLRLACGAVASGGYCPHRAGDGELALHVSQRLPTAIGM